TVDNLTTAWRRSGAQRNHVWTANPQNGKATLERNESARPKRRGGRSLGCCRCRRCARSCAAADGGNRGPGWLRKLGLVGLQALQSRRPTRLNAGAIRHEVGPAG